MPKDGANRSPNVSLLESINRQFFPRNRKWKRLSSSRLLVQWSKRSSRTFQPCSCLLGQHPARHLQEHTYWNMFCEFKRCGTGLLDLLRRDVAGHDLNGHTSTYLHCSDAGENVCRKQVLTNSFTAPIASFSQHQADEAFSAKFTFTKMQEWINLLLPVPAAKHAISKPVSTPADELSAQPFFVNRRWELKIWHSPLEAPHPFLS